LPRFAKTRGIVLRKYDFSETSQIVSILTRDFGRLRVLAKGSRRVSKKRVPGFLDHLSRVEIVFIPKPGDQLSTLTDHEIVDDFRGLRRPLRRLAHAYLLAELFDLAAQDGQTDRPLHELAVGSLARLERSPPRGVEALSFAAELRLLRCAGFGLGFERCVATGTPLARCRSPRMSFALGGLLDGSAGAEDRYSVPVSPGVMALLGSLSRGGFDAAERARIPSRLASETRSLLVRTHGWVFERRIRTARFLEMTRFEAPQRPPAPAPV